MQVIDRVRELRRVPANQLKPNPRNWRTHPTTQRDALRGVLADVGFADALVARELDDGTLELVDGHLRAETAADALVPVLVVDLTNEESRKVLLTHDALADMAGVNHQHFNSLLNDVEFASDAVDTMLAELAAKSTELPDLNDQEEIDIPDLHQVVVECDNERQQESLFEQLRSEGYRCRVMTL